MCAADPAQPDGTGRTCAAVRGVYGRGSAAFDPSVLKAGYGYVLDLTGKVGTAAICAPTIIDIEIKIKGMGFSIINEGLTELFYISQLMIYVLNNARLESLINV